MRHKRIVSLLVVSCLATGLISYTSYAEEQQSIDILTDEQRKLIVNNCTELQSTLNQIHQNDALARRDRGQLYRTIADRLMSPFNQRAASSNLDASALVQTAAQYNTQYQAFSMAYRDYELALRNVMQISCSKQPTVFYDALLSAREKRTMLYAASQKLVSLAERYKKQFVEFQDTLKIGTKKS